jgi:hypothetical protein
MLVRKWLSRNIYALFVGMQISTTTMENRMEITQRTKDRTATSSSNMALPKPAILQLMNASRKCGVYMHNEVLLSYKE